VAPLSVGIRVEAPLIEVFASIQGEGRYVGEPQVLVRLRGCPLRCRWCDTPGSWLLGAGEARVAARGGTRREPAWATPFQAACWIAEAEPGAPRTVSVTGGEPLLWPEFLLALRGLVGRRRMHLETGGAHPRALERVLGAFDHVSLDLKPFDDLGPPVEVEPAGAEPAPRTRAEWAAVREACLRLVRGRDACAKLVVAGGRAAADFDELLEALAEHAPDLPLVLQPVTPRAGVAAAPPALLEELVERARSLELAVRVVPQVHRLLGLP
jgi:organic radical activating enzyme